MSSESSSSRGSRSKHSGGGGSRSRGNVSQNKSFPAHKKGHATTPTSGGSSGSSSRSTESGEAASATSTSSSTSTSGKILNNNAEGEKNKGLKASGAGAENSLGVTKETEPKAFSPSQLQSYKILNLLPNRMDRDSSPSDSELLHTLVEFGLIPVILPIIVSYSIDLHNNSNNDLSAAPISGISEAKQDSTNSNSNSSCNSNNNWKLQFSKQQDFIKSVIKSAFVKYFENRPDRFMQRLSIGSKMLTNSMAHSCDKQAKEITLKLVENEINTTNIVPRETTESVKLQRGDSIVDLPSNIAGKSKSNIVNRRRDWSSDYSLLDVYSYAGRRPSNPLSVESHSQLPQMHNQQMQPQQQLFRGFGSTVSLDGGDNNQNLYQSNSNLSELNNSNTFQSSAGPISTNTNANINANALDRMESGLQVSEESAAVVPQPILQRIGIFLAYLVLLGVFLFYYEAAITLQIMGFAILVSLIIAIYLFHSYIFNTYQGYTPI